MKSFIIILAIGFLLKITGWKSVVQDIKNAGAEFIDQEVVEDGNLISSRQPADLPAFIKASLRKLG